MENIKLPVRIIQGMAACFMVAALGYIGVSIYSSEDNQSFEYYSRNDSPGTFIEENIRVGEIYDAQVKDRDIWGCTNKKVVDEPSFGMEQKHELPSHLKVVAVLVGKPSQVVIENMQLNETVIIDEGATRGDLKLERIEVGCIFLNYQGQTIEVITQK